RRRHTRSKRDWSSDVCSSDLWAQEKLYQLINYRYTARLATVITSNLVPEKLEPRIGSRLRDHALSKVIEIDAPDYRRFDPGRSQIGRASCRERVGARGGSRVV